ncbi:MAG: hypothetical protein IJ521_09120, partial [Schwartzia sp.]|nr:hypothetical protein [Schwartzia sp. (in: firmicutes)]
KRTQTISQIRKIEKPRGNNWLIHVGHIPLLDINKPLKVNLITHTTIVIQFFLLTHAPCTGGDAAFAVCHHRGGPSHSHTIMGGDPPHFSSLENQDIRPTKSQT